MMEADPRCGGVLQGVGSKMLRYVENLSIFPSLSRHFFGSSRFFQRTKKKDGFLESFGMIQSDSMNLGMRFKT